MFNVTTTGNKSLDNCFINQTSFFNHILKNTIEPLYRANKMNMIFPNNIKYQTTHKQSKLVSKNLNQHQSSPSSFFLKTLAGDGSLPGQDQRPWSTRGGSSEASCRCQWGRRKHHFYRGLMGFNN